MNDLVMINNTNVPKVKVKVKVKANYEPNVMLLGSLIWWPIKFIWPTQSYQNFKVVTSGRSWCGSSLPEAGSKYLGLNLLFI